MQMNYKAEVKYNSYLDDTEIGDLTCSVFESFIDFCDYVTVVAKFIPEQLKHDPNYRDIHEARMNVFVNGEKISRRSFRREGNGEIISW